MFLPAGDSVCASGTSLCQLHCLHLFDFSPVCVSDSETSVTESVRVAPACVSDYSPTGNVVRQPLAGSHFYLTLCPASTSSFWPTTFICNIALLKQHFFFEYFPLWEDCFLCLCLFLFWCKFCNLLTRLVGSIPMFSTCSSMFNLYIFLLSILRNYISWERWRPIVPKVYPIPSPHMMYKSASGVRRIGGTGGQKWALRVVFRVWMKWILNIAAWCVTAVEVRRRAL